MAKKKRRRRNVATGRVCAVMAKKTIRGIAKSVRRDEYPNQSAAIEAACDEKFGG